MLNVEGLFFAYNGIDVLEDIRLEVKEGDFLGVLGPNGSGKSTLLKCMEGVLRPRRGRVLLDGLPLLQMSRKEVARRLAVVPQGAEPGFDFSVFEMVLMGRTPHIRPLRGETRQDLAAAEEAMRLTGTLGLAARRMGQLSGGEKQRVVVARALAQEPKLLLLDEPTSYLDINHQIEIFDLVKRLNCEHGLAVVVVLHDLNLASQYCDHLVMLDRGRVFARGGPSDILTRERIRTVYGTEVEVIEHPKSGNPHVIPLSWSERERDAGIGEGGGSCG